VLLRLATGIPLVAMAGAGRPSLSEKWRARVRRLEGRQVIVAACPEAGYCRPRQLRK
jgi:hypothetical protein